MSFVITLSYFNKITTHIEIEHNSNVIILEQNQYTNISNQIESKINERLL